MAKHRDVHIFRISSLGHETSDRSPKDTRYEARRAESRDGVLGEKAAIPLPTSYGIWGRAVSSSSGVRGRDPAAKRFYHIRSTQEGLSWHFSGVIAIEDRSHRNAL